MKEVLTNDEIDTLLEMFRGEGEDLVEAQVEQLERAAAAESDEPSVSPMDLMKPNRLNRSQLFGLERTLQATAAAISAVITEKLRLPLACDCVAVEQMCFSTWASQLTAAVGVYVLRAPSSQQPFVLSITSDLLYGAVDRLLGGSGRVAEPPEVFTPAEFTVADALVVPCGDAVQQSLSSLVDTGWIVESRTCHVSMVQVVSPFDVVLSVYFQVSGEFLLGDIRLVLPLSALQPRLDELWTTRSDGFGEAPSASRKVLERRLLDVPLRLQVGFRGSSMKLRELLALGVGDFVPFDLRDESHPPAAAAAIGSRPKFAGRVDRSAGRHAFCVDRVLDGASGNG